LLVPLVLRPSPLVIVRDVVFNVVVELVVGFDGVARKIGTVARVATFRYPKIVDERIWRQTCLVNARRWFNDLYSDSC
jgi:hypothetical protein